MLKILSSEYPQKFLENTLLKIVPENFTILTPHKFVFICCAFCLFPGSGKTLDDAEDFLFYFLNFTNVYTC